MNILENHSRVWLYSFNSKAEKWHPHLVVVNQRKKSLFSDPEGEKYSLVTPGPDPEYFNNISRRFIFRYEELEQVYVQISSDELCRITEHDPKKKTYKVQNCVSGSVQYLTSKEIKANYIKL